MEAVESVNGVNSILDIGAGFGKYGIFLRERYDVRFKRVHPSTWRTRIDCVEIWKPYISAIHAVVYDNIFVKDIFKFCKQLESYDVILMIECLEHMPKWKGKKVLRALSERANKLLIVSFPTHFKGGENKDWDNPYEEHRCLWTKDELDSTIGTTVQLGSTLFKKEFNV